MTSPSAGASPRQLIRVMRIIARLNIGGPAIHVALLTTGLSDSVFQTTLVTGTPRESEGDMSYLAREMGVTPVVISSMQREISLLDDLSVLWALVRLMRRVRPHIVHTHTAKAGFVGRLAAWLTGVPVIVHTFHGHTFRGYFGPVKTRLFIWLERAAALATDAVLTISDGLRVDLIEFGIAPPARILVVPLGLPLAQFADTSRLRGRFRAEMGFSTGEQLVGIIGRLVPVKNHELFLAAAAQVLQAAPQARFIIVGDGERRADLEALTADMGLRDAVRFTGWRSDLPAVYADLDAVVITSVNEGTPVSLIEAMAAGVPVVSTAVGGVPDLLRQGELGLLVPPDDLQALADALTHLLCERPAERTLRAQEWILAHYGSDRLIADIRRLYCELLGRAGIQVEDVTCPVIDVE